MGLNDTLVNQGSRYSKYNGQTPNVNPLATRQSKLHGGAVELPGDSPSGYSINGAYRKEVTKYYAEYDDGVVNALPEPSNYDIDGIVPRGPLRDPNTPPINNTFEKGEYLKNLPK
jgi:hypothetical protein